MNKLSVLFCEKVYNGESICDFKVDQRMTIFFLNVLCFVIITDSYIIATNLVVFLSLCGTIGKIDAKG